MAIPQILISLGKSFGKQFVKHILSPKKLFQNLVKRGKGSIKNMGNLADSALKDGKKLLKKKLNFKDNISSYLDKKKTEFTDKVLGINSKATYQRHKAINQLKKAGASVAEILEFEKEYSLDPDKAKAEYHKLVRPKEKSKEKREAPDYEEDLPRLEGDAGVLGDYVSKAWSSLSKSNNLHSKDAIQAIIDLDDSMDQGNKDILNDLLDAMDESNLMQADNAEQVQRQVAIAAQASANMQEKIAEISKQQTEGLNENINNIGEMVKMYSESTGSRIDMLGELSKMATEKEEPDNSNSFADLLKGNSLMVDLVSQSQKSPVELLKSFDDVIRGMVQDFGKDVGFYGKLAYDSLKSASKFFSLDALAKPLLDMLASLLGIDTDDTSEDIKDEDVNTNLTARSAVISKSGMKSEKKAQEVLELEQQEEVVVDTPKEVPKEQTVQNNTNIVQTNIDNSSNHVVTKRKDVFGPPPNGEKEP